MRRPSREAFAPLTGVYTRSGNGIEHDGSDVVCYDTETSGKDTRNGQIYQFGYIHADRNLVAHRQGEVDVRRLPYVVPTPGAMRVTGLGLDQIDAPGRPEEFEAAAEIASVLSFPPGVQKRLYLTFNGIKFDDPLIATTLERNLRDPGYIERPREQGKRHAGDASTLCAFRIDMLHVARLAVAVAPERFKHTLNEKGVPSLKLETLAQANGIPINAHNAVGDSQATLGLARLVKERIPEVWTVALRASHAHRLKAHLQRALERGEPVWLHRHFSQSEVVPCHVLWNGKGRVHLVDLMSLERPLPETAADSGTDGLVNCKDCHIHDLSWGSHPFLLTPDEARPLAGEYALPMAAAIHARVAAGEFRERLDELRRRMVERPPYRPWPDQTSEEDTTGWKAPSRDDAQRMERFVKATSWVERAGFDFDNPRLRDFAARLVAIYGDLDVVAERYGEARAEKIRRASTAAFRRPYAGADARWATVAGVSASEEADDAFREWIARAYDAAQTHPGAVPPSEPVEDQPTFRF